MVQIRLHRHDEERKKNEKEKGCIMRIASLNIHVRGMLKILTNLQAPFLLFFSDAFIIYIVWSHHMSLTTCCMYVYIL